MFNTQRGYHTYYIYILTNKHRSTFYIGVTKNLKERLKQHRENTGDKMKAFTSRYNVQFLVYYQRFTWIQEAIAREKELKGWIRAKKIELIRDFNPTFEFLNHHFE